MAADTTVTPDVGPDITVTPDIGPDTAATPDLGLSAGKCATAPTLTLVNGTVTISDDIAKYSDEFGGVNCPTTTSATSNLLLDGPQAYYKWQGVQDQWYRITVESTSSGNCAYFYVFTNTSCTKADIEADCQSGRANAGTTNPITGDAFRTSACSGSKRTLYYKATANAPVYVAIDDTDAPAGNDGSFTLKIDAIPTPTNGTCANATALTFFSGKAVASGDTSNTMTPDEFSGVSCPTTAMDGPQAYYKFTAKANTAYKVKVTHEAGYLLYFYVFGNTCTEAAISADCGSGGVSGIYNSSSISPGNSRELVFTPPAAGDYTIAIDSTTDYYFGQFTLEVEEFVLPTNGKCASPDAIALINGKATITGSTLGLTNEFGTNIDCTGTTDYDGEQAYYTLTAAAGKAYKMTFAPGFSSYWYVFRAASCGATTAMNADCGSGGPDGDNYGFVSSTTPETAAFKPAVPGDYIIAIDSSAPGTAGSFQLDIEEFDAPTNDTACSATPVTFTNGKATINGSTFGASNEFGVTSSDGVNCSITTVFDGPQVYYEFTVDATKGYTLRLTPTNFTSAYMYLFQKGSCAARSAIDADCGSNGLSGEDSAFISQGNTGTILFSPSNSGQYVVAVDTSDALGGGDFVLEIEELTKPTNQTCATAAPLTLTNGEVTVNSTTGFALDEYSGLNCRDRASTTNSSVLDGPQLYWSLTIDATKNYAITGTTTFASGYMYVFDGSKPCSESNIETDCTSNGASGVGRGVISSGSGTVYFKPPATGTYKIAIDSYANAGDVSLRVVEFDAATNQTCATAQTLTFTNNLAKVEGFTIGAADEFAGAIKCGGTTAYAGGQTYYKVTMQAATDYFISMTADHKSAVYLFSPASACTATAIEADCASAGTTGDFGEITATNGGTAGFSFRPAAAGDYYIVVDTPTAADVGGYTLTVNQVIPPTGPRLVIQEVNVGSSDYVVLRNAGTVDVSLNGVELVLYGISSTIASPDNKFSLPNQTLTAGSSLVIVETASPQPGELYIGGNIPYTSGSGLIALLCQGACSATSGTNVIDAARLGGTTSAVLPTGVTFAGPPPTGLTFSTENTLSYTRVGFIGSNPSFAAADWTLAAATR
jgi:hypothetical protein